MGGGTGFDFGGQWPGEISLPINGYKIGGEGLMRAEPYMPKGAGLYIKNEIQKIGTFDSFYVRLVGVRGPIRPLSHHLSTPCKPKSRRGARACLTPPRLPRATLLQSGRFVEGTRTRLLSYPLRLPRAALLQSGRFVEGTRTRLLSHPLRLPRAALLLQPSIIVGSMKVSQTGTGARENTMTVYYVGEEVLEI